jgi:hypothetical protein
MVGYYSIRKKISMSRKLQEIDPLNIGSKDPVHVVACCTDEEIKTTLSGI